MEKIILHPSQLANAKQAGFVRECDGKIILKTPCLGPFEVIVSKELPAHMGE